MAYTQMKGKSNNKPGNAAAYHSVVAYPLDYQKQKLHKTKYWLGFRGNRNFVLCCFEYKLFRTTWKTVFKSNLTKYNRILVLLRSN